ncbi:TetR family transcriptional regulator [Leifsonia sp. NPDC058292]|uniref:TetR/AcrR family transcriptional regulator n=1 Tax=Leifsonia sp. NPDC058292 TaxID=3346428 RepID=UPI0036DC6304
MTPPDPELGPARKRPTGRRTGDSGTRDAILDAARDLFAERGLDGASVRAIANAAGVDPALIRHFFGDKGTLFAATVANRTTIPQRIAETLVGDPATVGRRVTDTYLRLWEEPATRPTLLSLVRSAVTSEHAADMLIDVMVSRVRTQEGAEAVDDIRMRQIALAASHLLGVAIARYVLKAAPVVALDRETIVDEVSPAIQRYLTGARD